MPPIALTKFIRTLQTIDFTRRRMEELYNNDRIALRDLQSVYEALFLRAVTGFEVFLEELFISILQRRTKYNGSRVSVHIKASSDQVLMDILLQGDKYMNWLPFDRTENRARLYLRDGRPFSELTNGDKSMIKTITVIRHAIAHKGRHAMAEFNRTVIGSQVLLRGERTPAGFLRSQVRTSPVHNRFQVYVAELARVARALC
jgi:hypothetical protein